MKKQEAQGRTPARKLNRQELETGVLAAGCGTQGCPPSLTHVNWLFDPAVRLNVNSFNTLATLRFF